MVTSEKKQQKSKTVDEEEKACSHTKNNSNYVDLRHSDTWKHGDGADDDGGGAVTICCTKENHPMIAKGERDRK